MITEMRTELEWQERAIRILVVGCGGNGSAFVQSSLYRIHLYIKAMGHEHGLRCILADGSKVTVANTYRSSFWPQDVGHNKAELLASRMNCLGIETEFSAIADNLSAEETINVIRRNSIDFVITAVDVPQYRAALGASGKRLKLNRNVYWLDMGNLEIAGNVVLGHLCQKDNDSVNEGWIPNILDLYPEIKEMDVSRKPSCSAAESLKEQSLLVNQQCALLAGRLLGDYLSHPSIKHHGYFFDFETGTQVLNVNPKEWAAFGYCADKQANSAAA